MNIHCLLFLRLVNGVNSRYWVIDSAINNLKRFTDMQCMPSPYVVQPYRQNELVAINNYQELPLDHLLQLWQHLNRQIIFMVDNLPAEKLHLSVDPAYDNNEIKTLGWLICDYVAHMEHHWKQVFYNNFIAFV